MPYKAKHPCAYPGCNRITERKYCDEHAGTDDGVRGSSTARGYNYQWQKASKAFLRAHPLCVMCLAEGRYTPATVVDHIKPHRSDKQLFWDERNWQGLCKSCHDQKTAAEDGGFGNTAEW